MFLFGDGGSDVRCQCIVGPLEHQSIVVRLLLASHGDSELSALVGGGVVVNAADYQQMAHPRIGRRFRWRTPYRPI